MKVSFTPNACKGEDAKFSGVLVINLPSAEDRLLYLAEANVDINELGSRTGSNYMRLLALMLKKAFDHIEKVDMVKKDGNKKLSNVDDLRFDPDCFTLCIEIANQMMNGFSVGKA